MFRENSEKYIGLEEIEVHRRMNWEKRIEWNISFEQRSYEKVKWQLRR